MSKFVAGAIAISLIIAGGCGGQGASWVGSYEGRADIKAPPGADEAVLNSISKVTLEIQPNGEFVLVQMGLARAGEVSFNGETARLSVKTFADKPIESLGDQARDQHPDLLLERKEGKFWLQDPSELVGFRIELTKKAPAPK